MDIYKITGKAAIGSRLRKVSEMITEDAAKVYALYEVDLEPRWFPVFFVLAEHKRLSVMEIAQFIKQSHASVSQVIKEMKKHRLIKEVKDEADGRRTLISLSAKGEDIVPRLKIQMTDVKEAVEELFGEMQYDLWKAIEEMEYMMEQKNLLERVRAKKKEREAMDVQILDYRDEFQPDFKGLNIAWIETYFKLEQKDVLTLNNPRAYILEKGGHILVAKYENEIVGVCALLKMDETTFELAKMAVHPKAQGKSIGWLLGKACIEKATALGAEKLFLESNTVLKPALNLYKKLGFVKVTGKPSPYERANIQMELLLRP